MATSGNPPPTFSEMRPVPSDASLGIVEIPGLVASRDNWAEHGFPDVG